MRRILLTALSLLLVAGCTPLPPGPADTEAKRFESAADKSVIYIVRTPMDSWEAGTLALDDNQQITTYRGTYYRWIVAPGSHHVGGYAGAGGSVNLVTAPGKIYYLQHTVLGSRRSGMMNSFLRQIGEPDGRALVTQAELLR